MPRVNDSFGFLFGSLLAASFGLVVLLSGQPAQPQSAAPAAMQFTGVNMASGSFGADQVPGTLHTNYTYPQAPSFDYFASKGMNTIRLTVLWERLQHRLMSPLHEPEMQEIDAVINAAGAKGMKTIVDIHNYAKYKGAVIGSRRLAPKALADLWSRLSTRYKNNGLVVFGLMNEPTGLATETWLQAVNLSIKEIRKTGAQNLILVPGNGFSSARDWYKSHYGTPNSQVMLGVTDPGKNVLFEVHQYFDRDFTGTYGDCPHGDMDVMLAPFTDWARKHGKRGFLGEFGVGSNSQCLEVLDRVLKFMYTNSDVWVGWTYWAAGPWWAKDYYTDIEPIDGKDRPQMSVLEKYLKTDGSLRQQQ